MARTCSIEKKTAFIRLIHLMRYALIQLLAVSLCASRKKHVHATQKKINRKNACMEKKERERELDQELECKITFSVLFARKKTSVAKTTSTLNPLMYFESYAHRQCNINNLYSRTWTNRIPHLYSGFSGKSGRFNRAIRLPNMKIEFDVTLHVNQTNAFSC